MHDCMYTQCTLISVEVAHTQLKEVAIHEKLE